MSLVSVVRQCEVPKKEDSRKQAKRYQTSELGKLFAPFPYLTGFRKTKEQAVGWIKSELCWLEITTFLQYILWKFIGTPYWIHAFFMATIAVTNLYFFLSAHKKPNTIHP